LTAAGTWAAIEPTWPDELAGALVLVLVLPPLPQAAAANAVSKSATKLAHEGRIWRILTGTSRVLLNIDY